MHSRDMLKEVLDAERDKLLLEELPLVDQPKPIWEDIKYLDG